MNVRLALPLAFYGVLVTGCSSMRAVPTPMLVQRDLPGAWDSGRSKMQIFCSGAFSFERPDVGNIVDYNRNQSGSVINELRDDAFVVGPITKSVYKVQRWPARNGDAVQMTVDDDVYTRTHDYDCQ
ncbi:MAG TPA: hypothetical protein VFV50_12075 [Bdellovibrionales bacterium]|nr:hypothetical protein [Bdellovibrionales bacterium]